MNKLEKNARFSGIEGPVLTIVMDGVGLAPNTVSNAVASAYTPTLDALMAKYPMVALKAHGTAVGLPSDDDMGNSEVGHNILFAPHAFVPLRQFQSRKPPSPLVFFLISTHFTATLGIPLSPTKLKSAGIGSGRGLSPRI